MMCEMKVLWDLFWDVMTGRNDSGAHDRVAFK
jgi:hypothetical protein